MTSGRLSGREDCCVCTLTIHNTVVIAIWSTVTSSVCHCVREEQEEDMMNLCLLIFLRKLYILPTVGFVFVWTNSNQRRETQQGGRQRGRGRESEAESESGWKQCRAWCRLCAGKRERRRDYSEGITPSWLKAMAESEHVTDSCWYYGVIEIMAHFFIQHPPNH